MIEIPRTNMKQQPRAGIKSKKNSGVGSVSSNFTKELDTRIYNDFEGSIDELLTDLQDQEKRFLDLQSLYELERYKLLVRKILKMILERGFESRKLEQSP